jgi:hypothetical protein
MLDKNNEMKKLKHEMVKTEVQINKNARLSSLLSYPAAVQPLN